MKQSIIIVCCLCISLHSFTQDPSYSGPAKDPVKTFWNGVEDLEWSIGRGGGSMDEMNLVRLSGKIGLTKRLDPSYNTSAMETKLKTLKENVAAAQKKGETAEDDRRKKTENMWKVAEMIRSLFQISVSVDNGALPTIKQKIEAYKKTTADLLTMDKSDNESDLKSSLIRLKGSCKQAERNLNAINASCHEQTAPENAEREYYELMYNQAFWDAAQKVYPDEPDFKKAFDLATKLLQALGTVDDVHTLAVKSKQKKISDTKLPSAVVKDAALEKMFIDAYNKRYGDEDKAVAIKAVITSDDWQIERNEITGIVTGRIRRAILVLKKSDGKCYLTGHFNIHQEYVGNSFSTNAKPIYGFGSQEMLCENVK